MDSERRSFEILDDGTLDTVIKCCQCGEEMRYNYPTDEDTQRLAVTIFGANHAYEEWLEWVMDDVSEQHDCSEVTT